MFTHSSTSIVIPHPVIIHIPLFTYIYAYRYLVHTVWLTHLLKIFVYIALGSCGNSYKSTGSVDLRTFTAMHTQ